MALMVRFQPGEGSCLAEARVGTSEARRQALFAGAGLVSFVRVVWSRCATDSLIES